MTAGQQRDENRPPEPLVEERGDGPSPTIAQAGDDVAELVVGDRRAHADPDDDRPITDEPADAP